MLDLASSAPQSSLATSTPKRHEYAVGELGYGRRMFLY
jgi:hypothetical protein